MLTRLPDQPVGFAGGVGAADLPLWRTRLIFQPLGWTTWISFRLAVADSAAGRGGTGDSGLLGLLQPAPLAAAAAEVPVPAAIRAAGRWPVSRRRCPRPEVRPRAHHHDSSRAGGSRSGTRRRARCRHLRHPRSRPRRAVRPHLGDRISAKAPASDIAAAATAAALSSALAKSRARRRRGAAAKDRGYRDEYLDMDSGPTAPPAEAPG